jgi:hypothetical protein
MSSEERTNSIALWNKYNMMVSSVDKLNAIDQPTYTRKQVEDMLDMVGNCYLDTIVCFPSLNPGPTLILTSRTPFYGVLRQQSCPWDKKLLNLKPLPDHMGALP